MAWSRQLLPVVALLVGGCGDYEVVAPGGGGSPGSGGAGTGGTSAVGGASASGGNAPSGGAPTTLSGGCDDAQQPLLVTLPHDECQGQAGVTPPAAPGDCLLWTESGYLAVFSDARGVVVASLGADGVTVSETVLSTQAPKGLSTRLSRNGDEILVVLDLGEEVALAVLDLQGASLSALSRLAGEAYAQQFGIAVTPSGDGWLVAFGYSDPSAGGRGILLSQVSQGGVVSKQVDFAVGGYVSLNGFAPGDSGDFILDGTYDSGGQFGAFYEIALYVDPELETVSCVQGQLD